MTQLSDASLKGKVKSLAKRHGLMAQEVLQMHLLERLLWRLSESVYSDQVILKGGLLIAAMTGISQRTTMDMDTTIKGLMVNESEIVSMVKDICETPSNDGITFEFIRIEPIRPDDEYSNFRVHLEAHFGKIAAPLKIDITTGDVITPSAILYPYRLLLSEETISLMAYPKETIVAEKFETVIRRGAENSRARDYYDLHLMHRLYEDSLEWGTLHTAIYATAEKRGSLEVMPHYRQVLNSVRSSDYMVLTIWEPYVKANPYASNIAFNDALEAVEAIGERANI